MIAAIENVSRPVHRLSEEFAAVRLHFEWFGVRKTLNSGQKSEAASSFGADGHFLSAGKKLLDTKHEAYKKVTGIRGEARKYWQNKTLPYPEAGIRMIKLTDVEEFDNRMNSYQAELRGAVLDLDRHLPEMIENARDRLGRLFDPTEYPTTFMGLFSMEWDFPNMRPPEYLRMANPQIYEQEMARIQARFNEAAAMAEEAFLAEFADMVSNLRDRMEPDENGNPKKFKQNTVENLKGFFDRFAELNIGCRDDLESLVEEAQRVMNGVTAESLRDSDELRERIHESFSSISSQLGEMIETAPRRSFG